MNDGLISIKDRKKREKNLEELKELASKKAKSTFNPYKYVSPTLVKSSPVRNPKILVLIKTELKENKFKNF